MIDPKDVATTKTIRLEFTRHFIDASLADIRVMHGTVTIRGTLKAVGGSRITNLREEVERILRHVKTKTGCREIVLDVNYRG